MDSVTSISIKTLNDDNSPHPMFNVAAAATEPEGNSSTENNAEDGEISIFDAEKYFSEESIKESKEQVENLQKSPSLPSSADGYGRSFVVDSLLSKHFALSKRWSTAKNWFFRRNCCCINGKSVGVKEAASKSDQTVPIVLIDTEKSNDVVQARAMDFPRQQRISATGRPFINGAAAFTFPISDRAREDDAGSDASSDLFEIESFSTQPMASAADEDFSSDRNFGAGNLHRSRLSVAALSPQGEEAAGLAEEHPMVTVLVGGRQLPADKSRRETSQPSPLVAAN